MPSPHGVMACVCQWCGTPLPPVPCRPGLETQITHGICPACATFMLAQALERLDEDSG